MDQEMVIWICLYSFKYFHCDLFIHSHRYRMPQYATLDLWPCATNIKDVFFKLEDVSQSSLISSYQGFAFTLRWEMTEKRPLVLKKTSLITYTNHVLKIYWQFARDHFNLMIFLEVCKK